MNFFRGKRDAELWPNAELRVLFPDRSLRVDKKPRIVGKLIISYKFERVFRFTTPLRVYKHLRGDLPGAQPVPTNKYVWVMTGKPDEEPSEEEFQEGLELVFLRSRSRALEQSNKRRWTEWWIAIGGSILVVLLNFAKFFDVLHGWWP